jgi:hypothetical protein
MTTFEKFCLSLWLKIVSAGVCAVLAGCGAVVAGPADTEYDAALIAIVDADMERPELPDSLDEQEDVGAVPVVFKVERPKVQMFVTRGCPPCEQAKRDLTGTDIPFVVMKTNPRWVESNGFPTFAWKVGETWHYYTGWVSLAHFRAEYEGSLR